MLHVLIIVLTIATWMVTNNLLYTAAVLGIGWVAASLLSKVLTWVFYALLIGLVGLYVYAHQTDQSFMLLLWKVIF
jgi:hypothetical protein